MILVFTGNGKGKTTAALGQAVRVLGRNGKALFIQFIKGPWKSGEDYFASVFGIPKSRFKIVKSGKGFVGILGDKLPKKEHIKSAEEGFRYFTEEKSKNRWDLIVLDEINVAVSLGLLKIGEIIDEIKDFPEDKILILTGRNAPKRFIKIADLATEMKEIKHPFSKNKKAAPMVEF